jgi:hypothetical protein
MSVFGLPFGMALPACYGDFPKVEHYLTNAQGVRVTVPTAIDRLPRGACSFVVNTRGKLQLQICDNAVCHSKYERDDALEKLMQRGMPLLPVKNDATYVWAVCMIANTQQYEQSELTRQGRSRTWDQNFVGRKLNDGEKMALLRDFLAQPIPPNSRTPAGAETAYSATLRTRAVRALAAVTAAVTWTQAWQDVRTALVIRSSSMCFFIIIFQLHC